MQPVWLLAPARKETDMDDFIDDNDGIDWEDWMIIGPMSEDIAKEKREQGHIRRELNDTDDEYWDMINRRW
jgi:hypothetical protein